MPVGLALVVASARAQPAEPVAALSLRDAVTQALARNYSLRIEQQEIPAAAGELESSRAAYVPEVTAEADFSHEETPDGNGEDSDRADAVSFDAGVSGDLPTGATYRVSANIARTSGEAATDAGTFSSYDTARGTAAIIEITQPLLRNRAIDGNRLDIRQSTLALDQARLGLIAAAHEVVYSVEQAYFDLVAARETVRVREAAMDLASRTLEDTRRRIAIGSLPDLDEKDAQAQVAASEADLIDARQTQREAENTLLCLITDDFVGARLRGVLPDDPLDENPMTVDFAASAARALENRPEIRQAELSVELQELAVRYQKNQRLPELNAVLGAGVSGSDDHTSGVFSQWGRVDHPYLTGGVTLSLPWTNRRSRGQIQSAQAQLAQARLALGQQRESILAAVDSALESVRSSFERIAATRTAREYAEAALAAEEQKFSRGRSTSFTVLQMQRDVTSARADEIVALADYNKALSTLRLREGVTLEMWQIQVSAPDAGDLEPVETGSFSRHTSMIAPVSGAPLSQND